jgi:radical SAM superfamily enzyme YgiQ (UPF0313 family)
VGYESGSQQIRNNVKKGARRAGSRGKPKLGITIHGTFILGLPGRRARPSPRPSASRARSIPTRSRSPAAPYPGTALYEEAQRAGSRTTAPWTGGRPAERWATPFPRTEIFRSLDEFYCRFYFRPRKMISLAAEMLGIAG